MIRPLENSDISIVNELLSNFTSPILVDENYFKNPFYKTIVYTVENLVVGVLVYELKYENMEIDYIIVDKNYRNKKIASKMMDYLLLEAKKNNIKNITLEVRESNKTAINIYEKYGFKKEAVRSNYYGSENGILMRRGGV